MNAVQRNPENDAILQPEEHVLSTLQADGSRRWLKPVLNQGRHWHRRRIVAYLLIAVFTLVPFIKIAGKPMILLNIVERRFTILGFTFLPTDTVLLAIFMVGVLLSIFAFTALFGRVWCGWACPQTVYMEFLIRPIERLFEGTAGRGGRKKNVATWRMVGKYTTFLVVCFYLANTFLAYFVGVEELGRWMTQSPLHHPVPFAVMAFVTIAMMFDFCYFREQMCIIACPYGRFQSVLLDQNSLIVSYDQKRGEPRGHIKKSASDQLPVLGDCIDCNRCVTTCPTGIDIRDGLQMECINCTQCIDACNAVMQKVGRPKGLIRYSSQSQIAGKAGRLVRARTVIYPVLLCGVASAFFAVLLSSKSFDAVLLREPGNPYTLTESGRVRNLFKLKITNRTNQPMTFVAESVQPKSATINFRMPDIDVPPEATVMFPVGVVTDTDEFDLGRALFEMKLSNQEKVSRTIRFKLIGPYN